MICDHDGQLQLTSYSEVRRFVRLLRIVVTLVLLWMDFQILRTADEDLISETA